MNISAHTDYALRMLIRLATSPDEYHATPAVSEAYGISYNHLNKVATGLAQHGFVEVRRGRHGGMKLAKPPEEIRIGDVVRCFENMNLLECFDEASNQCVIADACKLTPMFEDAMAAFLGALDQYTLRDVLHQRSSALRRILGGT